jgi:hypothetical protein
VGWGVRFRSARAHREAGRIVRHVIVGAGVRMAPGLPSRFSGSSFYAEVTWDASVPADLRPISVGTVSGDRPSSLNREGAKTMVLFPAAKCVD